MVIKHNSWITEEDIRSIEKEKKARYICDNPLKTRDGSWANFPIAIFYANEKHTEGSNWFGLFQDSIGRITITNAESVENRVINGLLVDEKIIYSSYRNDFVCLGNKDGLKCCIDGGLDYLKTMGNAPIVKLQITKDGLRRV